MENNEINKKEITDNELDKNEINNIELNNNSSNNKQLNNNKLSLNEKLSSKSLKRNGSDNKKVFSTAEVILLVMIVLVIGFTLGSILTKPNVISGNNTTNDEYLNEFIENYEYVINNYYEDIDREELINNAISGMMESLDDPYSVYFNEEETNNFSITLNGSYKGIGIQIVKDEESGYMFVRSVFEDSPAEEAGVQVGDKIVSVDDMNSKDVTASEFSNTIVNSSKDSFNMKIIRGEEEINITLKRKMVVLDSVSSKIIDSDKKIGYIYIGIFANNTYEQFKEALENLEKENIEYLIIDVRSNTGGHLTAVDDILDLFLNKKQILYKMEKNDEVTEVYGTGNENKTYEIVLLGDSVSASASEVLIGSLKENLNSIFIGKKTYGKGTVQELVTLSDGTQYKITVKKWLTPNGNWVNDTEGIEPDIEVDLDEKYYETGEDSDDTQLQKAIDYINNK